MASRSPFRPTIFRPTIFSTLLAAVVLVLGLAGCGGGAAAPPAEQLPPGPELLARSADVMAKLKTVALDVQVDQALTTLPIRSANGKLTAAGEAVGTAVLNQGGSPVELQFVVAKGVLFLKGPTGTYQRLPLSLAASIYDPTALLRPDTGVAALLRTSTAGVTEASDTVNGVAAYRVHATLNKQVAQSVVPGISGATNGRVWLDKATSQLLKAQVDVPVVPTSDGAQNGPTAPVTVVLTDFDAPVTITAPPAS